MIKKKKRLNNPKIKNKKNFEIKKKKITYDLCDNVTKIYYSKIPVIQASKKKVVFQKENKPLKSLLKKK